MTKQMKKLLIIVGIVLGSIIVLGLIVRGVSGVVVTKRFNTEMERMKAEGIRLDFRDFEIQCEDRENAALPWKEIEEMFRVTEEGWELITRDKFNKVLDGEILTTEERARISEIIAKNKKSFEKFKEVIKRPYFKYNTDWDITIDAYFKFQHANVGRFMRFYSYDAILKADKGRLNEAVEQCSSMLKFSKSRLDEPFLRSYAYNLALARPQIELLNRIISSKNLDNETLLSVIEKLETDLWHKGLIKSFESERALCFDTAKEVLKGNPEIIKNLGLGVDLRFQFWLIRPIIKSDILYAMKIFDEIAEIIKMPYYKASEHFKSFEEKKDKIPRQYFLFANHTPNPKSILLKKAIIEAEILAANAGIACKIFKNRHGTFPDELSQLVPDILSEVPTDPFTGKPMIYRRTSKGFIVYSVGANGKDEGGRQIWSNIRREKDDDWGWYERKE